MLERLNLYDILVAIVPGVVLVCEVATLFPGAGGPFRAAEFPGEFALIALFAASLLAGLILQTLGSMLERPYFCICRGRPSDRALDGNLGDRYLPSDAALRIEAKLRLRFGDRASKRALFLGAMNLAESTAESKASTFNAQYGQIRSVFTLFLVTLILLGASRLWGAATGWWCIPYWMTVGLCVALVTIFAWRTWQRGAYYAREVLFTAERLLDNQSRSSSV